MYKRKQIKKIRIKLKQLSSKNGFKQESRSNAQHLLTQ